jgi:GxxExxY protein
MALTPNDAAREVVDAAYRIHVALGPGLLESVYETVLEAELRKRGLAVARQLPIPLAYDGMRFPITFRADLMIENILIVEIKAVEVITPLHKKQLLTYLRLSNKPLGLLLNFNSAVMKQGVTRIVNGLRESAPE